MKGAHSGSRRLLIFGGLALLALLVVAALLFRSTSLLSFTVATLENASNAGPQGTSLAQASPATGLLMDDPLRDNSLGHRWDEPPDAMQCVFKDGGYVLTSNGSNGCLEHVLNLFNFRYQAQVTVLKGTDAGLIFRHTEPQGLYDFDYFHVSIIGHYTFEHISPQQITTLDAGFCTPCKQGLNQPNLLMVKVVNSTVDLYVNNQHISTVTNVSPSDGSFGFSDGEKDQHIPNGARFQNVKIWSL